MQPPTSSERAVTIAVPGARISADLTVPTDADGVVVFAHGSGSSRHSSRNRFVAAQLQRSGLATLLLDLLTPEEELMDEESGGRLRFDIAFLAERLEAASAWVRSTLPWKDGQVGYFGASTGAAAALVAAARQPELGAIVSRGGRPDLAHAALAQVRAPTLLIVGGADDAVLELNRQAFARLECEKKLVVVPGATHLFEERGTLEQVAQLAAGWFQAHLPGAPKQG